MRDLEIRGAGNVLGAEQHGHMDAVGYDLYCKLLNQAVRALTKKSVPEEEDFETLVECDIDAFIPAYYIKNEFQKLDIYKRISAIENEEDAMDMQDELIDRFGDIPKPVDNLLAVAGLKAAAHLAYITEVKIDRQEYHLTFFSCAKLNPEGIIAAIEEHKGRLTFAKGDGKEKPDSLHFHGKEKNSTCLMMMDQAKALLIKLAEYVEK